ncbi:MAG: EAL domain-containing protein [Pseudolabrys sp.]
MLEQHELAHMARLVPFGHRQVPPRVCVVDNKPHVRMFLAEMLEQIGFITCECSGAEIRSMITEFFPDLIVVGPLGKDGDVPMLLRAIGNFEGKVMLFGGRSSPALIRDHEHGERMGLAMLPPLGTPFRDGDIRDNLRAFLPVAASPPLPVDVDEALMNGWLELWYQPKIDPRRLIPCGAEALIRVRHPTWGVVSPAYFVPAVNDPYFHALSQFAIMRMAGDRLRFAGAGRAIDISIRMPMAALEDAGFIDSVFRKLPAGAAQAGLLIEVECADVVADFAGVRRAATQLAFRNVGIAIAAIGSEGAALAGHADLPAVELKADRKFVRGCAGDRIKQAVCAAIVGMAKDCGARSVADGVESHADFLAVRELGFDLVQGPMFAKPMPAGKFEKAVLARTYAETV